jgi:hypothetical protein
MILAPEKRFIFIHVPKAAGTSVNGALSLHDAFYPVRGAKPEARRKHAEKIGLPAAAAELGVHASAKRFIAALGREAYDRYFKFTFVRNPWDVAVSWFHYRLINATVAGHKEAEAAGSFAAYVKTILTRDDAHVWVGLQHPLLLDDTGQLAIDFIGRYESLADDFMTLTTRLDIETLELDHFNQSYHAPWPQLYSRDTFAIVAALVARDAALFGYPSDPAAYGIS